MECSVCGTSENVKVYTSKSIKCIKILCLTCYEESKKQQKEKLAKRKIQIKRYSNEPVLEEVDSLYTSQ